MDNVLNRTHWWSIVLDDAAQLTDALNQAHQQGFEIETIFPHSSGIILVVKALITTSNVSLLRKGFNRAEKEKTPPTLSAARQPVLSAPPLAAAVGKAADRRRGDGRPANKT